MDMAKLHRGVWLSVSMIGAAAFCLICGLPAQAQNESKTPETKKVQQDKNQQGSEKKAKKGEKGESEEAANKPPARYEIAGQATFVVQHLFPFHSPYAGENSLPTRDETEISHTYTLFLGARLTRSLEAFINPEMALGTGIGDGEGLGSYTNDEIIGQPELRPLPYLARYFLRWRIPTGPARETGEARVGTSENILNGTIPARRVVITAGKFAFSDIFDANRYANDARTQFLNAGLNNNSAYDAAQDTRGYSLGLTVAWVNPDWALRLGSFFMPTEPGGPDLAGNDGSRGDQIEAEVHPRLLGNHNKPAILRLLYFRNFGTMGRFADALAQAQQTGTTPDVTQVRQRGAVKYGWGLNFEQWLGDDGATGVFGRYGWNNGATENIADECDRTFSFGGQISGKRWGRDDDRIGVAFVQNDLSAIHRDYLAAGGIGSAVGDGALRYGSERIVETYYSYQISKPLAVALDYQYINNPGYNRDRGPASVLSVRLHWEF